MNKNNNNKPNSTVVGELRSRGVFLADQLAAEFPEDVIRSSIRWWDDQNQSDPRSLVVAIRSGGMPDYVPKAQRERKPSGPTAGLKMLSIWEPILRELPEYSHNEGKTLRVIHAMQEAGEKITPQTVRAKLGPSPLDESA